VQLWPFLTPDFLSRLALPRSRFTFFSRVGRRGRVERLRANDRLSPAPHRTERTDFPYSALRTPSSGRLPCFGFPIERDLKLPNFVRGFYPGCPGHPRVLRFASPHGASVPPWLAAPFEVMQVNATMRDSDFSGDAVRLAGPASLRGRLDWWPPAGVLPAYLG